ncbi:MAG: DNA-processing protein DprA [Actinomycetota bacterium]
MRSDLMALTALASLGGMGPKRLAAAVARHGPAGALERLRSGRRLDVEAPATVATGWVAEASALDLEVLAADLAASGIVVSSPGDPDHPRRLADDIDPVPVLFRRGRPVENDLLTVGIVGTRRCTSLGREVARELGFGLAAAGVVVVSGLALGIDGAAHVGAVAAAGAPPLAFVGGGVDVVYPARHGDLWESVARAGTIMAEAPPGAAPARWRFPARNRLIAAVADIIVVVESRRAGGSMLTVDEAIRRDRQVMAVPGSVRNPAAVGTNALLADGCAPVTSVDDVLLALGLRALSGPAQVVEPTVEADLPEPLASVYAAVDDGATSLDAVVVATGHPPLEVLAAVGELAGRGLVVDDGTGIRRT